MYDTPLTFVVFSTNSQVLRIVNRLINKQERWECTSVEDPAQVLSVLSTQRPNIFLVAVGAIQTDLELWQEYCKAHQISLIQHYGGGSGLLYNSVQQYLDSKEQKS